MFRVNASILSVNKWLLTILLKRAIMRMQCLTHKQEVGAVHGVLSDLHLARSTTAFRAKRRSFRTQHLCTRKCKRAQRKLWSQQTWPSVRERSQTNTESFNKNGRKSLHLWCYKTYQCASLCQKDQLLSWNAIILNATMIPTRSLLMNIHLGTT